VNGIGKTGLSNNGGRGRVGGNGKVLLSPTQVPSNFSSMIAPILDVIHVVILVRIYV